MYRSQGLLLQAVMAYRQSLQLASQLGIHNSQVASLLRLALLALRPCMVSPCLQKGCFQTELKALCKKCIYLELFIRLLH